MRAGLICITISGGQGSTKAVRTIFASQLRTTRNNSFSLFSKSLPHGSQIDTKPLWPVFLPSFRITQKNFFPRQRLISRERMLPDVNSTTSGICYGYRAKLNMPRFSITDTKIVSCLTTRRIAKYLPSVRTFLRSCVPIFQNSNRSTWHVLIEKFQQTY